MLRSIVLMLVLMSSGCVPTLVKVAGPGGEEMYQANCGGGIAPCMNNAALACHDRGGYKIESESSSVIMSFGAGGTQHHLVFVCNKDGAEPPPEMFDPLYPRKSRDSH